MESVLVYGLLTAGGIGLVSVLSPQTIIPCRVVRSKEKSDSPLSKSLKPAKGIDGRFIPLPSIPLPPQSEFQGCFVFRTSNFEATAAASASPTLFRPSQQPYKLETQVLKFRIPVRDEMPRACPAESPGSHYSGVTPTK